MQHQVISDRCEVGDMWKVGLPRGKSRSSVFEVEISFFVEEVCEACCLLLPDTVRKTSQGRLGGWGAEWKTDCQPDGHCLEQTEPWLRARLWMGHLPCVSINPPHGGREKHNLIEKQTLYLHGDALTVNLWHYWEFTVGRELHPKAWVITHQLVYF